MVNGKFLARTRAAHSRRVSHSGSARVNTAAATAIAIATRRQQQHSSGLCFHLSSYLYEFVKPKFRGFYYMASVCVCVCVGRYCLLPEIIFINKICIWHLRREEAETKTRLVACVASTAEQGKRGEGMGRSSGHGLAFDTHTIASGLNRGRARITAGLSPRLSFGIQLHVVLCVCVCANCPTLWHNGMSFLLTCRANIYKFARQALT